MNLKQNIPPLKEKLNTATASKPVPPTGVKSQQTQQTTPPAADEKIQKLAEEVAHWKDVALRATAEMENLKKRTQIDIEKANRYATGSFAKDLLPVADCLEQAMTFARSELSKEKEAGRPVNPIVENLLKGVEMTAGNLTAALKKQQIEKVDSLGKLFDPNIHKVIQEIADPSKPAGTIVQELQSGYTIGGDRVLREAMVVVSK